MVEVGMITGVAVGVSVGVEDGTNVAEGMLVAEGRGVYVEVVVFVDSVAFIFDWSVKFLAAERDASRELAPLSSWEKVRTANSPLPAITISKRIINIGFFICFISSIFLYL